MIYVILGLYALCTGAYLLHSIKNDPNEIEKRVSKMWDDLEKAA